MFLAVLALVALAVRLSYLKSYQSPLTGDAAIYAKIAWGLKNGHGLHWWSVVWSPFYPFMIFLFSLFVGSLESATSLVSVVLGSLLVVPFFFLAKKVRGHKSAYLGSILVIFFPALVVTSVIPLSEATYTFFLLSALLSGWLLILTRSYLYALLFGMLSGLCYLTRPEFLVGFAFLLLLFLIVDLRGRLRKKAGSFVLLGISLIGFLIPAIPYMGFMHSQTGHWILSGKTAHNILKQRAYAGGATYSEQRQAFAEILDGLTEDGQVKGRVLLGEESMFSFFGRPGFFGDYFERVWMGVKKIDLFFLPFLLLSLFYIFSWRLDKEGWKQRLFFLCAFSPMLTMPIFFTPAGRLIEPYAPVLILLSVAGLFKVINVLIGTRKSGRREGSSSLGMVASFVVVLLLSVFSVARASRMAENHERTFRNLNLEAAEYKKLGLWADNTVPRDAQVMFLSKDTFFFYCNRVTFTIPFAPFEKIVHFARENKVDYLLVSVGREASWRDDLAFLLEPLKDRSKVPQESGLKLGAIFNAPSGLAAVLYQFVF